MSLFVDTSVWSLAFRRDRTSSAPEVRALRNALEGGDTVLTTGLILQELCKDLPDRARARDIIDRFAALPLLPPDRQDHRCRGTAKSMSSGRSANWHDRCCSCTALHSPRAHPADDRQ